MTARSARLTRTLGTLAMLVGGLLPRPATAAPFQLYLEGDPNGAVLQAGETFEVSLMLRVFDLSQIEAVSVGVLFIPGQVTYRSDLSDGGYYPFYSPNGGGGGAPTWLGDVYDPPIQSVLPPDTHVTASLAMSNGGSTEAFDTAQRLATLVFEVTQSGPVDLELTLDATDHAFVHEGVDVGEHVDLLDAAPPPFSSDPSHPPGTQPLGATANADPASGGGRLLWAEPDVAMQTDRVWVFDGSAKSELTRAGDFGNRVTAIDQRMGVSSGCAWWNRHPWSSALGTVEFVAQCGEARLVVAYEIPGPGLAYTWATAEGSDVVYGLWDATSGLATVYHWDGVVAAPVSEVAPFTGSAERRMVLRDGLLWWVNGDSLFRVEIGSGTPPVELVGPSNRPPSMAGLTDFSDLSVEDGVAAWRARDALGEDDHEIVAWDGASAHRVTDDDRPAGPPATDGDLVVWWAEDESVWRDTEIYLWRAGSPGEGVTQLTSNDWPDESPRVANGVITWLARRHDVSSFESGRREVMLSNGSETLRLTHNDLPDDAPHLLGSEIVWRHDVTFDLLRAPLPALAMPVVPLVGIGPALCALLAGLGAMVIRRRSPGV